MDNLTVLYCNQIDITCMYSSRYLFCRRTDDITSYMWPWQHITYVTVQNLYLTDILQQVCKVGWSRSFINCSFGIILVLYIIGSINFFLLENWWKGWVQHLCPRWRSLPHFRYKYLFQHSTSDLQKE